MMMMKMIVLRPPLGRGHYPNITIINHIMTPSSNALMETMHFLLWRVLWDESRADDYCIPP
jgi:hypothetical protein